MAPSADGGEFGEVGGILEGGNGNKPVKWDVSHVESVRRGQSEVGKRFLLGKEYTLQRKASED
jgi:hypothetical protein